MVKETHYSEGVIRSVQHSDENFTSSLAPWTFFLQKRNASHNRTNWLLLAGIALFIKENSIFLKESLSLKISTIFCEYL